MAISDKITRLNNAKTAIKNAIIAKGVTVPETHGYESFASDINTIVTDPSGDATATAADLLSGKTAYSQYNKITGTMSNNGDVSGTVGLSTQTLTIPAGYTTGGTIAINDDIADALAAI